jgi:predicted NAD/FAD-binding protein
VPNEPSDMSFAVSLRERSFEWSSNGLNGVFGTSSNLVSPAFHGMLKDMLRFNR